MRWFENDIRTRETPSKFRPKSSPSRGCLVAGEGIPRDSFTGVHRHPKASMRPTGPKAGWRVVKSPVSARLSPAFVRSSLRSNTVTLCPKRADPCGPRRSVRTNPKVHPPFPPTGRPMSPPEDGPSRSSGCPVAGTPTPTRRPALSPEGFRLSVLSAGRPASNE